MENEDSRSCWYCGRVYGPTKYYQRYCGVNCRTNAWHAQKRAKRRSKFERRAVVGGVAA